MGPSRFLRQHIAPANMRRGDAGFRRFDAATCGPDAQGIGQGICLPPDVTRQIQVL